MAVAIRKPGAVVPGQEMGGRWDDQIVIKVTVDSSLAVEIRQREVEMGPGPRTGPYYESSYPHRRGYRVRSDPLDVLRFSYYPQQLSLSTLLGHVSERLFMDPTTQFPFELRVRDVDGDNIPIYSDQDLQAAIECPESYIQPRDSSEASHQTGDASRIGYGGGADYRGYHPHMARDTVRLLACLSSRQRFPRSSYGMVGSYDDSFVGREMPPRVGYGLYAGHGPLHGGRAAFGRRSRSDFRGPSALGLMHMANRDPRMPASMPGQGPRHGVLSPTGIPSPGPSGSLYASHGSYLGSSFASGSRTPLDPASYPLFGDVTEFGPSMERGYPTDLDLDNYGDGFEPHGSSAYPGADPAEPRISSMVRDIEEERARALASGESRPTVFSRHESKVTRGRDELTGYETTRRSSVRVFSLEGSLSALGLRGRRRHRLL